MATIINVSHEVLTLQSGAPLIPGAEAVADTTQAPEVDYLAAGLIAIVSSSPGAPVAASVLFHSIAFMGAYDSTKVYFPGQVVTSGGLSYICIQQGNGETPVSQPTFWSPLSSASSGAATTAANTFTAPQIIDTSAASGSQVPVTLNAKSGIAPLVLSDVDGPLTRFVNAAASGSSFAGSMLFYGSASTAGDSSAWGIGVDRAASTPFRDFFIERRNANGSSTDILYFDWLDGTVPANANFFGGNGGNAVTINSPSNTTGDPITLCLRPTSAQVLPAFAIQNGQGSARNTFQVYSDGRTMHRSALPTNGTISDGVTNTDTSYVSATFGFVADHEGCYISGTNIPGGTWIKTVTNATTVVLSQATTATGTTLAATVYASLFRVTDTSVNPYITVARAAGSGNITLNPAGNGTVSVGQGGTPAETATFGVRTIGTNNATLALATPTWGSLTITASGTSPGDVVIGTNRSLAMRFGTNTPTVAFAIDKNQNVLTGPGAQAAPSELATTATNGFFYVPTSNGTPTGVPATIVTGCVPMVVDRTGNKLWFYIAGAWKGVAVA